MENIEGKLKNLKSIKPDNDYSLKSLSSIISSPKISPVESISIWKKALTGFRLSSGVVLASALVLVIFISALYLNTVISPLFLPGLNDKNVSAEADQINQSININLNEIKYHQMSQEIAKSTLESISKNNVATNTTSIVSSSEETINQLLDELVK